MSRIRGPYVRFCERDEARASPDSIMGFTVEWISTFLDIVLHLDTHLLQLVADYGVWAYAILFLIIYCETGLVVTPFLPGDSLLFVAGAVCAMGSLQLEILIPLLIAAAFLGDNTNYWIGRLLGLRVLERMGQRLIKREHLHETELFYQKHGGKTVVLARFLPIFRTFAPFVAGIGKMNYRMYMMFSIVGGIVWIGSLTLLGYQFGNIPFIKDNLTAMVLAIVVLSFLPALLKLVLQRKKTA